MNKKTILSIALVCVLLVSSGVVASGVFSSFAREKAPIETEEQKISPMIFLPELPLPPEAPPVIPIPPELPPMPIVPEIPPVEIPETFSVSWLLDQLENNVTFSEGFEWLKEDMIQCLEDCINDPDYGDLDLSDPDSQTAFIQYVVSWWENWLIEHGDDPYAWIITYLIEWLNEWLVSEGNDINDLIEYMETLTPLIPEQPPEESPEEPPEESPEEPPVEIPELPEVITVNMMLDQLNHTIVPDGFEWLYVEIVSCLENYTGDKDANLREEENFTPFLNHVVECLGKLVLPEGFEQYQPLLDILIKCLEEWEGDPDDFIDYLLACIGDWAITPVPIPPEIPIIGV